MIKTEISNLAERFKNSIEGNPWYGKSLYQALSNIGFLSANTIPHPNNHSIASLIKHMISWREFAIGKLMGNNDLDIKINSEQDWPKITIENENQWSDLLNELESTQKSILSILEMKEDYVLDEFVPGKKYTFRFMIEGLLQHDIYHLGQIVMTSKMIGPQ